VSSPSWGFVRRRVARYDGHWLDDNKASVGSSPSQLASATSLTGEEANLKVRDG
jgi:hypothetical protein